MGYFRRFFWCGAGVAAATSAAGGGRSVMPSVSALMKALGAPPAPKCPFLRPGAAAQGRRSGLGLAHCKQPGAATGAKLSSNNARMCPT
ncbi:hypothetical protein GCM10022625_25550 [Deinococcus aetherius]